MADRTNRRVELSPLVAKRTVVDLKRTLSGKSVVISVDTIPQQTPTQSVRERRISGLIVMRSRRFVITASS